MPQLGRVVETKIHDRKGERNIAKLKTYQRTPETRVMWFLPDNSMYVYCTPPTGESHNAKLSGKQEVISKLTQI